MIRSSDPLRRSPLQDYPPAHLAVTLSEGPMRRAMSVRADLSDRGTAAALADAAGVALPEPRSFTGDVDGRAILWMAPDELLIYGPNNDETLGPALRAAAKGRFVSLTCVSDARAYIRLRGDGAREVAMKGCAQDLSPARFPVGRVLRTRLAHNATGLCMVADEPETIEVMVSRSYARHAWSWLKAAAAPNGALHLF